jgi:DNA integrity scanning protein DisA with diadenylate cyclase activity
MKELLWFDFKKQKAFFIDLLKTPLKYFSCAQIGIFYFSFYNSFKMIEKTGFVKVAKHKRILINYFKIEFIFLTVVKKFFQEIFWLFLAYFLFVQRKYVFQFILELNNELVGLFIVFKPQLNYSMQICKLFG